MVKITLVDTGWLGGGDGVCHYTLVRAGALGYAPLRNTGDTWV